MCEHTFVSSEATILHADLDAFFASVEQRDDPRLRGRPVIVGGGVVMAASYEARAFGVRTAMGAGQARRLCPHAVVVDPRMTAYSEASRAVFAVFHDTTPLVEGLSIDEAFLEVGGLRRVAGSPVEIAARLRHRVLDRVGLPITVGVARTKFLAKVASGVAKPDGLLVVAPDAETAFLHPLPVGRLWGVGPATARKLHERGVSTVGEVAQLGEESLIAILGPAAGRKLHALAHHRDPRPVQSRRRRRSMGSQRALGRGPRPCEDLDVILGGLVDGIAHRLRGAGRVGRTVVLRLRFDDFARLTRSRTLPQPTAETRPFRDAAQGLLLAARPMIEARGLTLIGVAVTNLDDDDVLQLALPFDHVAGSALDRRARRRARPLRDRDGVPCRVARPRPGLVDAAAPGRPLTCRASPLHVDASLLAGLVGIVERESELVELLLVELEQVVLALLVLVGHLRVDELGQIVLRLARSSGRCSLLVGSRSAVFLAVTHRPTSCSSSSSRESDPSMVPDATRSALVPTFVAVVAPGLATGPHG